MNCPTCSIETGASGHCVNSSCAAYSPFLYDEDLKSITDTLWTDCDDGEGTSESGLALALAAEMTTSLRRIESLLETLVIQKIKEDNEQT